MKNFIKKFKEAQTSLLGLIAKKELNINSVNGIPSAQAKTADSVTHEEALRIFKEYDEYVKESRKFEKDSKKVVVSKKLFLNFLSTNEWCNLFLFEKLDEHSKSKLFIKKEKGEAIDYAAKKKWPNVLFIFLGTIALCTSVWLGTSSAGNHDLFAEYYIVGMLVLFGSLVTILPIAEIISIKNARLKIGTVIGNDFLNHRYEYVPDDEYCPKRVLVSFANMPDYSGMIADSIPMQGSIGYIVRKNDEAQIGLHNMSLRMMGPVVPVILLKHSIVFDTAYMQNIDGRIFVNPPFHESHFETLKITREEWIPEIKLTPKMFI